MSLSDVKLNFEIGLASRPFPGETELGDRHLIKFNPDGALFVVIDGAGHGSEASASANAAAAVLADSSESALDALLSLCHHAIRSTRGAAISLASVHLSDSSMSWAGVGNVEGVFLRHDEGLLRRETLLLKNGVVGYEFTAPRVSTQSIKNGDLLIFATDGIQSFFLDGIDLEDHCQSIANSILKEYAKDTDDALVMVVRVLGRLG